MSTYTFTGPDERYYTDLGLNAKPGDVVKLDAPLDDSWELVDGQVAPLPTPEVAVEAPAAVAVPEPTETSADEHVDGGQEPAAEHGAEFDQHTA